MSSLPITIPSLISLCLVKLRESYLDESQLLQYESVQDKYTNMMYCKACHMYIDNEATLVNGIVDGYPLNWFVYYHDRLYHGRDLPQTSCDCQIDCPYAHIPRNICCFRCQKYYHNSMCGGIDACTYFDGIHENGNYHLSVGYESKFDETRFLLNPLRVHQDSLTWQVLQKVKTGKRRVDRYIHTGGFRGRIARPDRGAPQETDGTLVKPIIRITSRYNEELIKFQPQFVGLGTEIQNNEELETIPHVESYRYDQGRREYQDEFICDNCILEMIRLGELKYDRCQHQLAFRCEICEIFYNDNQEHYTVARKIYNDTPLAMRLAWYSYDDGNSICGDEFSVYEPTSSKYPSWYNEGSRICMSCKTTLLTSNEIRQIQ